MPTTSYTIVGWCLSGYWQLLSFKPPKGTAEGKALRVSHLGKACSAASIARVLPTTWPHNYRALKNWNDAFATLNLWDRFPLTPTQLCAQCPTTISPQPASPWPQKTLSISLQRRKRPRHDGQMLFQQLVRATGPRIVVMWWMFCSSSGCNTKGFLLHILSIFEFWHWWICIFSYRHCSCMIITYYNEIDQVIMINYDHLKRGNTSFSSSCCPTSIFHSSGASAAATAAAKMERMRRYLYQCLRRRCSIWDHARELQAAVGFALVVAA